MRGRNRTAVCAAVTALLCALGCGSDEGAGATGAASRAGNSLPVIDHVGLDPSHPSPGETLRAVVRARDPDGDPVELRHDWTVDGVAVLETGPELVLEGVDKGAVVEVSVVASDALGESEPAGDSVVVANRRPTLEAAEIEPRGDVEAGEVLRVSASGDDPDGDSIDYAVEWRVDGRTTPHRGPTLSTASFSPGTVIQARVVASDGEDESDPIDTPLVRIADGAPVIRSQPGGMTADGVFRYRVDATDPEGQPLRFSLRMAPAGMQIDPLSGLLEWRPVRSQSGRHPVEIVVEDGTGTKTIQAFEVTVGGGGMPAAPAER